MKGISEPSRDLVVTTIGTCRIADPIMAARHVRPLHRANRRLYGFVHTSAEVLQQIECLSRGRAIPEELAPFVSGPEKTARDVGDDADVYLVEISTIKQIRYREWLLQTNRVEDAFKDFRPLLDIFNRHRLPEDREARGDLLARHPLFEECTAIQQSILREAFVRLTTRAELDGDLAEVQRRLPAPVTFVCHVDLDSPDGRPLPARRELCAWMRGICAERGFRLIDPTPQVTSYGTAAALAQNGRDLNHYSEPFKVHYGAYLYDQIVGLAGPSRTAPPATVVLVGNARRLFAHGQYEEAEALLAASGETTPDVNALRGLIAYQRSEDALAAQFLRAAIAEDAAATEARLTLVKVLERTGDADEAAALAAALVQDTPDDLKVLTSAAKALARLRRYPEAIVAWQAIAALRPGDASALVEAARCAIKQRAYAEGLGFADAALAREPESAAALGLKTECLRRLDDLPALAAVLVQMAPLNPSLAMANLAHLIAADLLPQAAEILIAASKAGLAGQDEAALRADLVRGLTEQAVAAEKAGDGAVALRAWKALRALEPENKKAYLALRDVVGSFIAEGRSRAAEGDFAGAVAALRNGLALDDANARLLRELAAMLERTEDWAAATATWLTLADRAGGSEAVVRGVRNALRAEQLETALDLYARLPEEDKAELSGNIASGVKRLVKSMRADFDAGDHRAAAVKARAILRFEPENGAAERIREKLVSVLAKAMRQAADEDPAAQLALGRRVLELDPDHTEAHRAIGKIHAANQNHADARATYQRLTELEPEEARHWVKLAVACRGLGQHEACFAAASKASALDPANSQAAAIVAKMLNNRLVAA